MFLRAVGCWCVKMSIYGVKGYPVLFQSHWLLSHITIVKTTDSSVRGTNDFAMTVIVPRPEYWPSPGLNQVPPVVKSCRLPTELLGSALASKTFAISQVSVLYGPIYINIGLIVRQMDFMDLEE